MNKYYSLSFNEFVFLYPDFEGAVILHDINEELDTENIYICFIKNQQYHREEGPAVIHSGGTLEWYQNGKMHREDGPALIMFNGIEIWRQHGEIHREDGPAIVFPMDAKMNEWWIHDKELSEQEHKVWQRSRKLKEFLDD